VSWHARTAEQTLALLETRSTGLDSDEAERRLARFGANRLERVEPVPAWRVLLDQFASLVVLLLLAAALVSLFLGDVLEAAAIGGVLAINTLIGFVVELRARRAMDALLRYEVPSARVIRDGQVQSLTSDRLVPGDVVLLEEGDAVPADARLIESAELRTVEAPLTGESIPVDKSSDPVGDEAAALGDRTSMIYTGTEVVAGRAKAVVVHTGEETEVGRIGTLIARVERGNTPLEERLDALGRRLVWLTLAVAAVVTGLGVLRGQGIGLMVETGLALAIAAVPEGLPAVATIALAVGLRRMARRNALVRRLSAVEALGATTVVCTDKTGTLTAGEMTVVELADPERVVGVTGTGFTPVGDFEGVDDDDPWLHAFLEAAALTSRASLDPEGGPPLGDPTDAALVVAALKGGVDRGEVSTRLPAVGEVPFSSARRSSTSIHRGAAGPVAYVKGAPAVVLERCTTWLAGGGQASTGTRPLDARHREAIRKRNEEMADRGLRVIALARGPADEADRLTFLGLAGILDPPAPGVRETIGALRGAGIRTVMVTGDQRATARAVARLVGSAEGDVEGVDGRELTRMSDDELLDRMSDAAVLSRVSPEDKVRIVSALQRRGEVVAMLGDGVNDAAALKKADIGVAMGLRGTDVARQTASIVLTDDRFRTIGAAVEEGRVVYDNIRKFVFYLFSCNVAEVLVLLGASLGGLPVPLLPLQILWLNLVTDTFPALALALEPAEPDVMTRHPRPPDESILSRPFVRSVLFYAALITGVTLAAYGWGLMYAEPGHAITVAFMTLALAQLFHLGNARSRSAVLRPARVVANPWALASVPLVIGLQVAAVTWAPLVRVLDTSPLTLREWIVTMIFSAIPAVVGQLLHLTRNGQVGASP
jgi:Ca2+-transporting ATPase